MSSYQEIDYTKKQIVWIHHPKFRNQYVAQNYPDIRLRGNDFFEDDPLGPLVLYTLIVKGVHIDLDYCPSIWQFLCDDVNEDEEIEDDESNTDYLMKKIVWQRTERTNVYVSEDDPEVMLVFCDSPSSITLIVKETSTDIGDLPVSWVFPYEDL